MAPQMRPYSDDDLPRIQAALAGWIAAAGDCGYCHVGDLPNRIYAGLRGRHPVGELVQLWEHGGELVAIAINFRHETAFDLFTSPAWRGGEAEAPMLAAAYATTRRFIEAFAPEQGPVVTDVYGCDETRKALLRRLGFAQYRVWDELTERSLAGPIPAPQLPEHFSIRPATMGDAAQLAEVRNGAFDAGWTPEEYRSAVMAKPGYDPSGELVVVAPDGRFAAFTDIWLDRLNRVGLFEPVGTHRAYWRRGLARALMLSALHVMRRAGMRTALVEYDATNSAAGALYAGVGFARKDVTYGYRRP